MTRILPILAAALALVGCLDKRSGGGGGTPMVCGTVAQGGACTETADCLCNLTCAVGSCIQVVNPPQDPVVNVQAPTTEIRRVCELFTQIECFEDEPNCAEDGAEARARAEAAGCLPEFDASVQCFIQTPPTCDAQGFPVFSPACIAAINAQNECDCSLGVSCSTGTSSTSASTCSASVSQQCGGPESGADIECTNVSTSAGMIWVCTCEAGARVGSTFGVRSADDCCSFAEIAETQCGLE